MARINKLRFAIATAGVILHAATGVAAVQDGVVTDPLDV